MIIRALYFLTLTLLCSAFFKDKFEFFRRKVDSKKPRCLSIKDDEDCVLKRMNLTLKDYRFTPILGPKKLYDEIYSAAIKRSHVPRLGPDICNTFKELIWVDVQDIGIEVVDEDAFKNCTDLRDLMMNRNKIKFLPPKLFAATKLMLTVDLGENQLSDDSIPALSKAVALEQLHLNNNKFIKFPIDAIKSLSELEVLTLFSNELTDLDVPKLFKHLSHLLEITLNDNNFKCSRLKEIQRQIDEDEDDRLYLSNDYEESKRRIRNYPMVKDDKGFLCIKD